MKEKILKNKFLIGFFVVLILVFGYKLIFKKNNETRYLLTEVQKGDIIVSVSGTGQVEAQESLDIKPKISGELEKILVQKDQKVKKGDLLFQLKTKNANDNIQDLEISLQNSQIALEKLEKSRKQTVDDFNKTFKDGFITISTIYQNLVSMMDNLETMAKESSYGGLRKDLDYYQKVVGLYLNEFHLENEMKDQFERLQEIYEKQKEEYLKLNQQTPQEQLKDFFETTYSFLVSLSDFTRKNRDTILLYLQYLDKEAVLPPISTSTTQAQLTNLQNYTSFLDQYKTSLLSTLQAIDRYKTSIENYERDIESQKLTIEQKERNLQRAKEDLENYFIRAPFDGIIGQVTQTVKEGDNVSASTILGTLISLNKVVKVPLNEIDAVKVKIGQKAILVFDALPEEKFLGEVIDIDTIGTVSQGVVSYNVKILLSDNDPRIKSGMSVDAEIIVERKNDVLVLPNGAIKSQGSIFYVDLVKIDESKKQEYLNNKTGVILSQAPQRQEIKTGISNESLTEIVSGLKEGDVVVLSTIGSNNKITQNQRSQQFQIPGFGSQGGMRMR